MTANPDHILRPMGAASLTIEPDTAIVNHLFVSIVSPSGRCLRMASVPHDVAMTLSFDAAEQHFDRPVDAALWLDLRAGQLAHLIDPPKLAA